MVLLLFSVRLFCAVVFSFLQPRWLWTSYKFPASLQWDVDNWKQCIMRITCVRIEMEWKEFRRVLVRTGGIVLHMCIIIDIIHVIIRGRAVIWLNSYLSFGIWFCTCQRPLHSLFLMQLLLLHLLLTQFQTPFLLFGLGSKQRYFQWTINVNSSEHTIWFFKDMLTR